MKDMTLSRIATVCGGTYYGDESKKNEEIAGAVIDSRQVEPGYLFIPIKGERVDCSALRAYIRESGRTLYSCRFLCDGNAKDCSSIPESA